MGVAIRVFRPAAAVRPRDYLNPSMSFQPASMN
jgi:hypothetical protein